MIITVVCTQILLFVFFVLFVIDCIRFGSQIIAYIKYALLLAVLLAAVDAAVLLLLPRLPGSLAIVIIVVLNCIGFVRTFIFVCAGRYYSSLLGISDMPLLDRLFGSRNPADGLKASRYLLGVLSVAAAATAFSVILFAITRPQVSEWLKKAADIELLKTGLTGEPSLILALALMEFAIAEEIIFRLGIQNGLAKLFRLRGNGYWLAIAVSAALWALAHGNVINPAWVKMVQIFPIGLALGFLFRKYGVEACIVAHGIFNVVMMFWAPLLITE